MPAAYICMNAQSAIEKYEDQFKKLGLRLELDPYQEEIGFIDLNDPDPDIILAYCELKPEAQALADKLLCEITESIN